MLQSRQQKKPAQDQHSTADKEVKKGCKQEKRNYVKELAQEAENACSKEDIRTLYSITRHLSGKLTSTNAPIRDAIGKILTKNRRPASKVERPFQTVIQQTSTSRSTRTR